MVRTSVAKPTVRTCMEVRRPPGHGLRVADGNDVSKFIQQAKATADLLRQCMEGQEMEIPGTARATLMNSLWAIDDLLNLAQHALNGGEVLGG
jgi:hypothetical protein